VLFNIFFLRERRRSNITAKGYESNLKTITEKIYCQFWAIYISIRILLVGEERVPSEKEPKIFRVYFFGLLEAERLIGNF
jgi:hypothetical protein